jgi:subtilisin family serine protease
MVSNNSNKNYAADRIIVKLKPGVTETQLNERGKSADMASSKAVGLNGAHVWTLKPNMSVEQAIKKYGDSGLFDYVEPDYTLDFNLAQAIPSDSSFITQWGLHNTGGFSISGVAAIADADIDAPEAWAVYNGTTKVKVAVIDSGVNSAHTDLAANMIAGYDFGNNDSNPNDLVGHGTHVAGIVGAVSNNAKGVTGVAKNVQIMPLKINADGQAPSLSAAISAIGYAVTNGAKVINASWGFDAESQALYDAIQAAQAAGVLFIAAAGNDGQNNDTSLSYPANINLDNIISVAATTHADGLASFSNYGATNVDIGAPGYAIYSTIMSGSYDYMSGTSMAAPMVAGAAAFLWSQYPTATAQQIKKALLDSTDPLAALYGKTVTGGRLNIYNAITSLDIGDTSIFSIKSGTKGNDTLDAGGGGYTLKGLTGNDIYIVDSLDDSVVESDTDSGIDTVKSSVTFTLGPNLENLLLTGEAAINGTGNTLANIITGNSNNNVLEGGAGIDKLAGGLGNDIYRVILTATGTLEDKITEAVDAGIDAVVVLGEQSFSASKLLTLAANLENMDISASGTTWLNLKGNAANNQLIGNAAANVIDGGQGADTLIGGAGNDVYLVDDVADTVVEYDQQGTDEIRTTVTYTLPDFVEKLTLMGASAINGTGNALNNYLTGNKAANVLTGGAGNDTLDGGAGIDTLRGGAGNDIYYVDVAGDVVEDGEGLDTIILNMKSGTYSLPAGLAIDTVQVLGKAKINVTGNELNNKLIGNEGNNILDGAAGNDTLIGGLGNDIYIVDSLNDVVIETSVLIKEIDTVKSTVNWTLGENLENLILTGEAAINATGNALANTITGNNADNILEGGAGGYILLGGSGNDTYKVNLTASGALEDKITEKAGGGIDTLTLLIPENTVLISTVTVTLANFLENIDISQTGSAPINLNGNKEHNILVGNAANNTLNGGIGNDTLTGGAGDDTFVFTNKAEIETITDFASGDKLAFKKAAFPVGNKDALLTDGELVFFNTPIAGGADFSAATAAGVIGSASTSYALGTKALFVVNNSVDSAVFYFSAVNTGSDVTENELQLVGLINATTDLQLANFILIA